MEGVLLDSCIWVSLLNHDDSKHEDAFLLFEVIEKRGLRIVVPSAVVHEVNNVFLRLKKRAYVRDFLTFVKDSDTVRLVNENADVRELTMNTYLKGVPPFSLSYTDVYLYQLSNILNIAFYTFDKALLST